MPSVRVCLCIVTWDAAAAAADADDDDDDNDDADNCDDNVESSASQF